MTPFTIEAASLCVESDREREARELTEAILVDELERLP